MTKHCIRSSKLCVQSTLYTVRIGLFHFHPVQMRKFQWLKLRDYSSRTSRRAADKLCEQTLAGTPSSLVAVPSISAEQVLNCQSNLWPGRCCNGYICCSFSRLLQWGSKFCKLATAYVLKHLAYALSTLIKYGCFYW